MYFEELGYDASAGLEGQLTLKVRGQLLHLQCCCLKFKSAITGTEMQRALHPQGFSKGPCCRQLLQSSLIGCTADDITAG